MLPPWLGADSFKRRCDRDPWTPGALAAKQATTAIPIVVTLLGDPVASGIVASLARPEANITGQSFFSPELAAKRNRAAQGFAAADGSWRGLREADIKESLATERDGAEVISTLAPAF
jgi:hypothetical protein